MCQAINGGYRTRLPIVLTIEDAKDIGFTMATMHGKFLQEYWWKALIFQSYCSVS